MNFSLSQPTPFTWHVLIETLEQGQVAAWIAELPESKVVAESQEAAIAALKVLLSQRMSMIKVVPLQLPSDNFENSWAKVVGALEDNASFIEWSDRFWAEKQQSLDNEEILSVEECLRVM